MQTLLATCALTSALSSATSLTAETQLSCAPVYNVYVGGHDCCDPDDDDCLDDGDQDPSFVPGQCPSQLDCDTNIYNSDNGGCKKLDEIGYWEKFGWYYNTPRLGQVDRTEPETCGESLDTCEFDHFYQCVLDNWGLDYNLGAFASKDEFFAHWDRNNDCCLDAEELTGINGMSNGAPFGRAMPWSP